MSRLSFEKERAQEPAAHPAMVSVRVSGTGTATVDGTPVVVAPGVEVQQAVLDHLQRLAISLGGSIHATVHDDGAGCVVPLEVSADGASKVAGRPMRVASPGRRTAPRVTPAPAPTGEFAPAPAMTPPPTPTPPAPLHDPEPVSSSSSAPTPARGFDAVAEEVLGDGPLTETAEGAELLAEPLARINEAVRDGRIEEAADLADRTVEQASAVLGPHHVEVLHLRELTAYIAYLAGDPIRSFRLSLDLAGQRRRASDADAAYDNVRSAATAWRAVRDPEEGLRLGRDLIDLWTDLAAEPGPAASDPEPLESARARMVRLTDRAAKAAARP
ncbi:hypothetical protein [Streptomyces sp. NPDC047028]|uniref:hypothetical protein n=1 Tax=Streptomyces sp. NPDC047028 TaxID=3155793 RepID=UPI0033C5B118